MFICFMCVAKSSAGLSPPTMYLVKIWLLLLLLLN